MWRITGIGKIKVISTSKIKKIIAIKKNRIEKGAREKYCGLNPHSKGDNFSRSLNDLFPITELTKIKINEIIIEIIKTENIIFFKINFKVGGFMY